MRGDMSKLRNTVNRILENLQDACARKNKAEENWYIKELFELTYRPLRRIAAGNLLDTSLAGEVATDALIRAKKYIHTFNPQKDGYNWL